MKYNAIKECKPTARPLMDRRDTSSKVERQFHEINTENNKL